MLVASAAILAGPARGASSDGCAKFEEPLAYNACLARQGPHAGAAGGTRGVGEATEAPAMRGSHGRVRMEFTVTPH